jgi:CRP-like cAMP-binding protein
MPEIRHTRIARELFLFGFGATAENAEPWVMDRLTALLEEEETAPGQPLFRQGDAPDAFYFLRRGRVRLVRVGERVGAPFAEMEGRAVVGVVDAFLDRPRSHTALALTDLEVMSIRTDSWFELLEESFDLARLTSSSLARGAMDLYSKLPGGRLPSRRAGSVAFGVPARPLDLVERMALLMNTPALRRAGVQVLSDLAACSTEVSCEAGEVLCRPGSVRERLLLVLDGVAEAVFVRPRAALKASRGQIVGWPDIYGDTVGCEARAMTALRALAIRFEAWLDAMEEHPDMVRAGLAALALEHDGLAGERPGA